MTQVCVSTSASSFIFSCSSNPSFLSETLKPSLSFKRDLRRSILKNRKNLVAKAFSPDQSSRYGMRWMRDDVVVPYSPYCPVYANEEEEEQEHEHGGWVERGPPLMVAERFMAATTQLFQHRIIRCGGPVEDDMATMIVSQLLFLDAVDPESDIVMYINSPGGSVTAGMAIFDTMKHIRPDVSTVCVGLAASMGAFLLSAGTKGKRFSLPHARIMIHQPSGGAEGEESDMEIQCNEILHHKANLGAYLAYLCDQPIDRINRDTSRDFFMGAKEATDYGLIDGIIGLDGTKRLQPLAAS